ncbi:hypothetical protein GGX14DRAFT_395509 [Mycena pura]|uniref:Amidohydrolase-related domain-containing protein n=1 Tax=Mycena pura TaxID=153505 RepID=A0AAD6VG50_9AGAR|nr:hypothetical protein GGX14DRAFT_395509 [Mycena pura]
MDQYASIEPVVPELGVKVVFDHLGHPAQVKRPQRRSPAARSSTPSSAQNKNAYIKLSGAVPARRVPGLEEHIKKLLRWCRTRLFGRATGPHSAGRSIIQARPEGDAGVLTPDIPKFIAECESGARAMGV